MNTIKFAKSAVSTLVLAAAAMGAASSFAATSTAKGTEGEMLAATTFTSATTRAAVTADFIKASKSGQIVPSTSGTTVKAPEFMSSRSAAEVRAEGVVAAHTPVFGTI